MVTECLLTRSINYNTILAESQEHTAFPADGRQAVLNKSKKWAAALQNQQDDMSRGMILASVKNDMCVHRRLRSAWASAQSDQSLRCSPEEGLDP